MNNTLHTPGPQWVKVKRKRKFDPVKASAPMLLSTLQDICAMIVSPNDTRADILAHARAAIAKAEGK
jgi:hypothetical protein